VHKNIWVQPGSDTSIDEAINYFTISEVATANSDGPLSQKLTLNQFNLRSEQETLVSEHSFIPHEAKLSNVDEDETCKLE
jgi:hypothetical protein